MNLPAGRAIHALRWWIGAALFASTIINYIDRQTLSLLAPYLKVDYHWSNTDYAYLVIAFRFAYSIGQTVLGRLIDRIGTRRGLTLTVAAYRGVALRDRGAVEAVRYACPHCEAEQAVPLDPPVTG